MKKVAKETGIRRIPLFTQIIGAMLLGVGAGLWLGPATRRWGEVGTALIQLIRVLAVPLLFLSIVDAFLKTELRGRQALRMVGVSAVNACIALGIGLALSNALRPGDHLDLTRSQGNAAAPPAVGKFDLWKTLAGYVPGSVIEPFAENAVIEVVLLAVLFGAAARVVKTDAAKRGELSWKAAEDLVGTALRGVEVALGWVILFIPIAVFSVTAKTIGEQGFTPLKGLAAYVGVAILGLALQVLIVYQGWILLVAKRSLADFWRGARDAVVYAIGASSSLATLPVTLRCLDRMKVSPEAARLSACVGTNLNNDGILLYEAMAALFVAQAYGINLSLAEQATVAVVCLFAGIGIAGIPDAGLISLALVLATVGLPVEILPMLLTVDWLLSRARATTNVISDLTGAVVLDRWAGRPKAMGN